MARSPTRPADLDRELARLGELSVGELKPRYEEIVGAPLPKFLRRDFVELVTGYVLQSRVLGGHDRQTRAAIETLMRSVVPGGKVQLRPKNRKLRVGTRLIRQYQGRVHEVVVTGDGYAWKNGTYRSLTEIATAITGTKWNGWVFFGIKKPSAPTTAGARHKIAELGPSASVEESGHV